MNCSFVGANFRSCDFRNSELNNGKFDGSDFSNCNFSKANLASAKFRGTQLAECNFTGAGLFNTDFRSIFHGPHSANGLPKATNLRSTVGLSQASLENTKGDWLTILPTGVERPKHWDEEPQSKKTNGAKTTVEQTLNGANEEVNTTNRSQQFSQAQMQPTEIIAYLVEQTQNQLADHKRTPKPNTNEGLAAYEKQTGYYETVITSLVQLSMVIPEPKSNLPTEDDIKTIRQKLLDAVAILDGAVETLHQGRGLKSDLWRLGLVGGLGSLAISLGIPANFAFGVPAAMFGGAQLKSAAVELIKLKRGGDNDGATEADSSDA